MNSDSTKLLDEEILREHFAPHAPNPEDFAEGVQRRLAGAGADANRNSGAGPSNSETLDTSAHWWQSAAGLLPPTLLSSSALGAGATIGAKKASVKLLPTILAWPMISLFALGAALFVSLRLVSAPADSGEIEDASRAASVNERWWKQHWYHAALGIAVVIAAGFFLSTDILFLLLAASMLPFVSILRQLQRSGLGSRQAIGRASAGLLFALGNVTHFATSAWRFGLPGQSNPIAFMAAWPVLLFGTGLCALLSIRGVPRRTRHRRRVGEMLSGVAAIVLPMLLAVGSLIAVLASTNSREDRRIDQIREFSARFSPSSDAPGWLAFARAIEFRREAGEAPPVAQSAAWLTNELDHGRELPPLVLWAAHRMSLLPEAIYAQVAGSPAADALLLEAGRIAQIQDVAPTITALARTRGLDERQRSALVERLWSSLPAPGESGSMGTTACIADLLDELGASLADRPSAVHEILAERWTGACFAATARTHNRASDADHARTNLAAVDIIARVGFPPAVDAGVFLHHLLAVRISKDPSSSNVNASLAPQLLSQAFPDLQPVEPPDLSPPTPLRERILRGLVAARGVFGALLLVTLCAYATLRAPVGREVESE